MTDYNGAKEARLRIVNLTFLAVFLAAAPALAQQPSSDLTSAPSPELQQEQQKQQQEEQKRQQEAEQREQQEKEKQQQAATQTAATKGDGADTPAPAPEGANDEPP